MADRAVFVGDGATGSTAARLRISRLLAGVILRFWPEGTNQRANVVVHETVTVLVMLNGIRRCKLPPVSNSILFNKNNGLDGGGRSLLRTCLCYAST